MRITQTTWRPGQVLARGEAQWVLAFGDRHQIAEAFPAIKAAYRSAVIASGCTSGEIYDTEVSDGRVTVTAVTFDSTRIRASSMEVGVDSCSHSAGAELAKRLAADDLAHVFVLSDGSRVNGSALAQGFNDTLPSGTLLTGGLAGDGTRFETTVVGLDEAPTPGEIVAIGLYGDKLSVGFGSSGGWAPFGPVRRVTESAANVLLGRRIVLGQRAEEETEAVRDTMGAGPVMTGFYSYGELAPTANADWCQLHNQTMTNTTLREAA
ncbi:MAG: hypothetical protein ACI9W4_000569 [Rhodothermales bacterium]|jgi:hypothetical protein